MNETEARQLLALDEAASRRSLKKAYRRAMKASHPDLVDPDSPSHAEAITKTQRINEAYRLLGATLGSRESESFAYPAPGLSADEVRRRNRIEASAAWGTVILLVVVAIIVGLVQ